MSTTLEITSYQWSAAVRSLSRRARSFAAIVPDNCTYSRGIDRIALSMTELLRALVSDIATESQTDLSRPASILRSKSVALLNNAVGSGYVLSNVTRLGRA